MGTTQNMPVINECHHECTPPNHMLDSELVGHAAARWHSQSVGFVTLAATAVTEKGPDRSAPNVLQRREDADD